MKLRCTVLLGTFAVTSVFAGAAFGIEYRLSHEQTVKAFDYGANSLSVPRSTFLGEWHRDFFNEVVEGRVELLTEFGMLAIAGRDMAKRNIAMEPNYGEILCEFSERPMVYFIVRLWSRAMGSLTISEVRLRQSGGTEVLPKDTRVGVPYPDPLAGFRFTRNATYMFDPDDVALDGMVEFIIDGPGNESWTIEYNFGEIR